MISKASFAEISPSELGQLYEGGMSIDEVANKIERPYSFTRANLLNSGVTLRSKAVGTQRYMNRHPEWSQQFVKYHVEAPPIPSEEKILLLTMIATEGYTDSSSFGFTNKQEYLHVRLREPVSSVYGRVLVGRNGIRSRISSTEITHDLAASIPGKRFGQTALERILGSKDLTIGVLRVIADTEGSMIISVRKAPRNYTVECRVVLSSTNPGFTAQFVRLLGKLGIRSRLTPLGAIITRKDDIARFVMTVGFSSEAVVVRKRGNTSTWYGAKKMGLSKLFLRISREQSSAIALGHRGCFADCTTRAKTVERLKEWYAETTGGDAF